MVSFRKIGLFFASLPFLAPADVQKSSPDVSVTFVRYSAGAIEERFEVECKSQRFCSLVYATAGSSSETGQVSIQDLKQWIVEFSKDTQALKGRKIAEAPLLQCTTVFEGSEHTVALTKADLSNKSLLLAKQAFVRVESRLRNKLPKEP